MIFYGDTETYCEKPLKHGTYAYAESCEVMLFPYALDDGPVACWDITTGEPMPLDLNLALSLGTQLLVFHAAMFDRTVLRLGQLKIDIPVARWRCTLAQALAHSLPGGLEKLGNVLGIEQDEKKLKDGRQLIQLFCKPRPKNSKLRRATRETHPEEWRRFIEYAKADVAAMRAIYKKLPTWNYQNGELALWHLDQKINDRGIAIDLDLAKAAISAVTRAQGSLATQAQTLSNGAVESTTQRDKLLAHILEEHGVALPDMQKATLERRIEDPDLPWHVRELLMVRLQAATSSTAKYQAAIRGVNRDGRLRGTAQFCGASRTGRWAHRGFQPGNMMRPDMTPEEIEEGIEAIKSGAVDLLYDDVMRVAANGVRGVIVAPQGRKLVVADFSNIEGRKGAWLAGEDWKLRAFRDFDAGSGPDLYVLAYSRTFNVPLTAVTKALRQIGKVEELALQYQGAEGAFASMALTLGIDMEEAFPAIWEAASPERCREATGYYRWALRKNLTRGMSPEAFIASCIVKMGWREANWRIVSFWSELEQGARTAIQSPGAVVQCRRLVFYREGAWLHLVLPSGRHLLYPSPKVDEHDKITYMGVNQYSRKWQRLGIYGGKFFENATQASSRDVLAHALPRIEAAGYELVLTVHDEPVTETPDTHDYTAAGLTRLLTAGEPWTTGLPIAAAGHEMYRYGKKD